MRAAWHSEGWGDPAARSATGNPRPAALVAVKVLANRESRTIDRIAADIQVVAVVSHSPRKDTSDTARTAAHSEARFLSGAGGGSLDAVGGFPRRVPTGLQTWTERGCRVAHPTGEDSAQSLLESDAIQVLERQVGADPGVD